MVLKQTGETGLRLPGQIYNESETKAARLVSAGLCRELQPAVKVTIEKPEKKKGRKKKS